MYTHRHTRLEVMASDGQLQNLLDVFVASVIRTPASQKPGWVCELKQLPVEGPGHQVLQPFLANVRALEKFHDHCGKIRSIENIVVDRVGVIGVLVKKGVPVIW